MGLVGKFLEWTKNFSFMEKLVSVLLAMVCINTVYDKLWGDSRKQAINQATHKMFWSKLDEVRADNKDFHDKSLANQEKNNDRLYDLLTVGKRTAVAAEKTNVEVKKNTAATERIPEAAAVAADKIVEAKKVEGDKPCLEK